jgi:hypothetical protein
MPSPSVATFSVKVLRDQPCDVLTVFRDNQLPLFFACEQLHLEAPQTTTFVTDILVLSRCPESFLTRMG